MLQKRSHKVRADLKQICAKLNAASAVTRTIRNALGGHILPQAVQTALNNIAYDRWGVLEVGRVSKDTHFKMAGDLVVEIFADGVPESQKSSKIEGDIGTLAELLPVVVQLEEVINIYLEERDLI
jgi:hypothetical protein